MTHPMSAPSHARLVIDVQNDFLPGGALAVPDGDAVVPAINRLAVQYPLVVATQDWHPAHHGSFAVHHGRAPGELGELGGLPQVLWPVHCVQETHGAAFAPGLDTSRFAAVFRKGQDPSVDSYSAFFGSARRRDPGLAAWLRARGVTSLSVAGLATDYCVKATALDARALGYEVQLHLDACRGVELHPGDVAAALATLRDAGVVIAQG